MEFDLDKDDFEQLNEAVSEYCDRYPWAITDKLFSLLDLMEGCQEAGTALHINFRG